MNKLIRMLCIGMLCALPLAAQSAAGVDPITVYAAASLKESLDAVAKAWTDQSGQKVRISYAATSVLARQIEQGAAADVMISADAEWMDQLQRQGLIDAQTRVDLLRNRLVVIAPSTSTQASFDLRCGPCWLAALGDRRLAVAETVSVPAGRYARVALTTLGVWSALSEHLAQSDNVRMAMTYVALNESALGIVYATDAKAEPKVRVLAEITAEMHPPIVYPLARVGAAAPAASAGFLAFLRSAAARRIFEGAGFVVIAPASADVQR